MRLFSGLFFFFLWFVAQVSTAQYFGKSRSEDNEDFMQQDSVPRHWSISLKAIPLNKRWNLSVGGEIRYYYQNYQHVNFGEVPSNFVSDSPEQLLQRALIHTSFSWRNRFRIFTQLNHTKRYLNQNPINNQVDEDLMAFHQLFLEIPLSSKSTLRLGKQEEIFGGERLLAAREGPNNRMTHAGIHFRYKPSNYSTDVFWVRPMTLTPGFLDDQMSNENLLGIYFSNVDFQKPFLFDFYSIYFQSPKREYLFRVGEEKRNTFGFRMFSKPGKWQYSFENAYQLGTFKDKNIQAFMAIFDVSRQMGSKYFWGFSGNWVPGDKNYLDDQLNTFNTLFARPPFGQTVALNITNTLNLSPYIKYQANDLINLTLRASFVTRQSLSDGIFTPNMTPMRPLPNQVIESKKNGIGNIYTLDNNFIFSKRWIGLAELGICDAGDYLKETGRGKDVFYFAMRSAYKF